MTAQDLLNKALVLLGYTDSVGSAQLTNRIRSRAVTAINQVYADLFYALNPKGEFKGIENLNDTLLLPERILNEVTPYGVAAFIAQTEGDGENNQLFTLLFNSKRALLTHTEKTVDAMPAIWG